MAGREAARPRPVPAGAPPPPLLPVGQHSLRGGRRVGLCVHPVSQKKKKSVYF